jgi:hypothetical protein
MQYAMDARPISAPAPMMGQMQPMYAPAPAQLSPYMQELMRNYGYNPSFTRPNIPLPPDDFSRPMLQEMPRETPLSPYMQQLLQNYRVNNMVSSGGFMSPMAQ